MVQQIVDLPAHNVQYMFSGDPGTTIVGGPECLSTMDLSSYVEMNQTGSGIAIGALEPDTGGGAATGFGIWVPAPNVRLDDWKFVAYGYREGGGDLIGIEDAGRPDYFYLGSGGYYGDPVESYPAVTITYTGQGTLHHQISSFPIGEPADAFCPNIPLYVEGIFSVTGATGTKGLCPRIEPYYDYPPGYGDTTNVRIYYMAIRIWYTMLGEYIEGGLDEVRRAFT